ncbi:hypothetical protein L198_07823 [Cryptococcus wingfieldii CBS 7118]|uniref:Calpain catalytic domain-containing protein n=1 Tax=Cryptococcus wingfieldii CBS 7118 TaxID=1295528 RepID=A0A1E3HVI6_9TREE|nr:hypothetical protein L198_07823 [Cryptococcus wingfieldii CBS 7118]ODN80323.1 hypothetical protein L198_07823 [Cryptococcus wingfieldii CBS 7118]
MLPTAINTPTSSGPALWDPSTGPTCDDIDQTTAPDCWLASVMCSLAKCNAGFIKDLFTHQTRAGNPQTSLSVVAVTAKVWDPDTLEEEDQDVTLSDTGNGEGNDDASIYVWQVYRLLWPSALQAAVKKHGGSGITDGKFDDDGGFAYKALSYLTGLEAVAEMDDSKWWDMLVSHVDTSPMTVCTNSDTSKLVDSHCYTAMTVVEDGDTDDKRKVRLRNPWGDTQNYKMSKIKDDIQYVAHLKNWDAYLG